MGDPKSWWLYEELNISHVSGSWNNLYLGQGFVLFFQRSSGWVHLCVGLLHMVDLVMLSLLVPGDFPVRLCKLVTIFTLKSSVIS